LVPLLALAITAAPVIVIERAPGCPDSESVTADLTFVLESRDSSPASESRELRVRIDEVGERLRLEVTGPPGDVLFQRDLDVAGLSCAARSRAIAAVVERWIAGLAVPRPAARVDERPAQPRVRAAPRASPRSLAVRLGPLMVVRTLAVGLDLGAVLRISWVRFSADFRILLPEGIRLETGRAELLRRTVVVHVTLAPWPGAEEVEVGASLRLDLTTISTDGLSANDRATRMAPAIGLVAGASMLALPRLRVVAAIEGFAAVAGHSFYVATPSGPEEVHRTPGWGLEVVLAGSYDLLSN